MEYIDKSALIAKIDKLKGKVSDSSSYCNGWQHGLRMLEIELDTLEVKKIDVGTGSSKGNWRNKTIRVINADGNIEEITFNKAQKGE